MIRKQKNKRFELVSKFQPAGDQKQAIDQLCDNFKKELRNKYCMEPLVLVRLLLWLILLLN